MSFMGVTASSPMGDGCALQAAAFRPAVPSRVRVLAWGIYLRRLRYHSFLSERNGSEDTAGIRGMGTRIPAADAPDCAEIRGPGKRRFGNGVLAEWCGIPWAVTA